MTVTVLHSQPEHRLTFRELWVGEVSWSLSASDPVCAGPSAAVSTLRVRGESRPPGIRIRLFRLTDFFLPKSTMASTKLTVGLSMLREGRQGEFDTNGALCHKVLSNIAANPDEAKVCAN